MKQKFSHDNETASAGYYQVYFPDGEINAEASLELPMQMGGVPLPVLKKCAQITATKHVGMHRYTFMEGKKPSVVLFDVSAAMKLRPAGCTAATVSIDLEGWHFIYFVTWRLNWCVPLSFHSYLTYRSAKDGPVVWGQMHNVGDYSGRFGGFEVYFVARLNQRPLKYGVWNDTQMYHGRYVDRLEYEMGESNVTHCEERSSNSVWAPFPEWNPWEHILSSNPRLLWRLQLEFPLFRLIRLISRNLSLIN